MKNYINKSIKSKMLKLKPCVLPQAFPQIFSWEELERLLNLRPFVSASRFKVINKENYKWKNQSWLSDINTYPPHLLDQEIKKHHCYFSDASRVNPKINKICDELESIFKNSAADAHIYFTVADTHDGGFGIHWDSSHNLIVQVEGSTRFLLWDVYADSSTVSRSADSLPVDPVIDVTLVAGDAVFVPVRSYHQAISQTKRLSVSFPVALHEGSVPQDRHWINLRVNE